jgi:hypothetical protein
MAVEVAGESESQNQTPLEQIERADLVVGLLAALDSDQLAATVDALRNISGSLTIVVLQGGSSSLVPAAEHSEGAKVAIVPWAIAAAEGSPEPLSTLTAAYQALFALSEKWEARGCCLVASQIEEPNSPWIARLAKPLLEEDCDLVTPVYASRKFEGLLNAAIVAPLTRALYGKRILHPMGPDLSVSQRLWKKNAGISGKQGNSLESLVPTAICNNLKICSANFGARARRGTDWTNISSVLTQIIGPLFAQVEKNAACWQHNRASVNIPTSGERSYPPEETSTIEMARLVSSFQLGTRDLQPIWGLVLPPNTLFQLRKCSILTPETFSLPDELWARIIYDFALAYRLQTINRTHLLSSLAPLYLGWVASYARELQKAGARQTEQRIERLAAAFEAAKGYFVQRWRWPDRFNP